MSERDLQMDQDNGNHVTTQGGQEHALQRLARTVTSRHITAALALFDLNYQIADLSDADYETRDGIWLAACGHLPGEVFQRACGGHIKASKFFPRPAEINTLADKPLDALQFKADVEAHETAKKTGLHPDRLKPPQFAMERSGLRTNAIWADFLDTIHPAHEHHFFANAKFGEFAHIVRNFSKFEVEKIWEKFGGQLAGMFYNDPVLIPDSYIEGTPTGGKYKTPAPLSLNEVERRTQVVRDLKVKWGYNPSPQSTL